MASSTPKKRRGCLFWTLIVIVLFAVISCIVATPSATPAERTAAPATATAVTAPNKSDAVDTATEAPPTPEPTIVTDPNQGIVFGQPVTFDNSTLPMSAVLVTNTTQQVKTFTVKATYKAGDQLLATASGAVNHLLPNQARAVMLLSQGEIPTTADTVRVDVDTMVLESDTTFEGEASKKITFGQPLIQNNGSFTMVDVEVTNNDDKAHSFTVQAIFLIDGQLVGIATGAVNDIAPGQTKTASLIAQGKTDDATVQLVIETMVQ